MSICKLNAALLGFVLTAAAAVGAAGAETGDAPYAYSVSDTYAPPAHRISEILATISGRTLALFALIAGLVLALLGVGATKWLRRRR